MYISHNYIDVHVIEFLTDCQLAAFDWLFKLLLVKTCIVNFYTISYLFVLVYYMSLTTLY